MIKGLNYAVGARCALATAAKKPIRWIFKEEDLEEQFVRGSGPGGQKINSKRYYGQDVCEGLNG
jgi:hypothetical protein